MSLGARSWPDQGNRATAASGNASRLRGAWRRLRRRLLRWSPVALVVLIVAIGLPLVATYQPLQDGNTGGGSFPGLPSATTMRLITKYMVNGSELYIAPQRGAFALAGSVVNRGPFPVTILGVSQAPGSPFSPAGPVRYATQWMTPPRRHVLHDITLTPGQGFMIGMPLRIAYCADRRMYTGETVFLVTERFLGFTHTMAIPFLGGPPVVTNAPGDRHGTPGTFCSD